MMSSVLPVISSNAGDDDDEFWDYVRTLKRREMSEQGMMLPTLPSRKAWEAAGRNSENQKM
jgi:hypothetical protein